MQENPFEPTIRDPQDGVWLRYRLRSTKGWDVMLQECHDRIVRRKRLTLAQGMWLYNRCVNGFNHTSTTREPHNRMTDELREARATILKLQRRIDELEGARL